MLDKAYEKARKTFRGLSVAAALFSSAAVFSIPVATFADTGHENPLYSSSGYVDDWVVKSNQHRQEEIKKKMDANEPFNYAYTEYIISVMISKNMPYKKLLMGNYFFKPTDDGFIPEHVNVKRILQHFEKFKERAIDRYDMEDMDKYCLDVYNQYEQLWENREDIADVNWNVLTKFKNEVSSFFSNRTFLKDITKKDEARLNLLLSGIVAMRPELSAETAFYAAWNIYNTSLAGGFPDKITKKTLDAWEKKGIDPVFALSVIKLAMDNFDERLDDPDRNENKFFDRYEIWFMHHYLKMDASQKAKREIEKINLTEEIVDLKSKQKPSDFMGKPDVLIE